MTALHAIFCPVAIGPALISALKSGLDLEPIHRVRPSEVKTSNQHHVQPRLILSRGVPLIPSVPVEIKGFLRRAVQKANRRL